VTRETVIAIDGPGASGKSTLGAALGERLGYTYFDSSVLYRALTWLALQRGVDVNDAARLAPLAQEMEVVVRRPEPAVAGDGRQYTVLLEGRDVTWDIRSPEVDRNVSLVSAHPEVRAPITAQLRKLAGGGRMVMVGRDIGTVVLPDAALKIYLTASAEERARRRCAELQRRGLPADYDAILADLRRRDAIDGAREAAPMRPAADALLIDSDHLSVAELVELVLREAARFTVSGRTSDTAESGPAIQARQPGGAV
jgi:cytidylate kinase